MGDAFAVTEKQSRRKLSEKFFALRFTQLSERIELAYVVEVTAGGLTLPWEQMRSYMSPPEASSRARKMSECVSMT